MLRIGDFVPTDAHVKAVTDVVKSGRMTEGPRVAELEKVMQEYLGVNNAIMVTNGTVALQLVALYLKIKNRYKPLAAVTSSLTFPATVNAFIIKDCHIGIVDVGEDLQINIGAMQEEIKPLVDIMIPVHLMGYAADMDSIMEEAKKNNWVVVEDACESFGAEYKGKKVGTIGDFGCFSFYVSHNIIGGELGMVVTNDDEAAKMLRSLKNHGRAGDSMKFLHDYPGSNYKTNEFCAAIALENMKNVDTTLAKRKKNCEYYFKKIKNDKLKPYPITEGFSPLGYPIKCESEEYRTEICKKLNDNDIETREIFPCIKNQKAYKGLYDDQNLPVAEDIEKTVFYIGCHQYLTKKDKDKIIEVLNE